MKLNLGEIYVQIGAQTLGLKKGERDVKRFSKSANRELKTVAKSANNLSRILGTVVGVEAFRRTIMYADKMKGLQLQIQDMTRHTGDYLAVSKELLDIANRTGTSLEDNIKLAQNIGRAARGMGKVNRETLQFIELVNKAGIIGGASATEMKFAQRQLSQAMSSGIVRAEEMNSILENTPGLASEIAEGLGIPFGKLRKLMLDGKLESEAVFDAIIKRKDDIDKKFSEMPKRISQGFEVLKNGFGNFLSQLDGATGGTTEIADKLIDIGTYLSGDFTKGILAFKTEIQTISAAWSNFASTVQNSELFKKVIDGAKGVVLMLSTWGLKADEVAKKQKELEDTSGLEALMGFIKVVAKGLSVLPTALKTSVELMGAYLSEFYGWAVNATQVASELIGKAFVYFELIFVDIAITIENLWRKLMNFLLKHTKDTIGKVSGLIQNVPFFDKVSDSMGGAMKKINEQIKANEKAMKKTRDGYKSVHEMADKNLAKIKEEAAERKKGYEAFKSSTHDQKIQIIENAMTELTAIEDSRKANAVKNRETQEANAKALEDQQKKLAEEKNFSDQLKKDIENQKEKIKLAKEAQQIRDQAQSQFDSVESDQLTPTEAENERYANAQASLEQARELQLETILGYDELEARMAQDHQDRLDKIKLDSFLEEKNRQIQGVRLAGKMATDLHSLFLKTGKEKTAAGKAAFLAMKAMAIAEIAINTQIAASKVASNPVLYALTLAQGAVSAGIVAGTAIAEVSGSKAVGGNASAFNNYRVNEQGPELLTMGGEDYLMMGSQQGRITPANQIGGDTIVQPKINIINQTGTPVRQGQATTLSDGTIQVIISEAVERSVATIENRLEDGGNSTSDTFERNYGVQRAV